MDQKPPVFRGGGAAIPDGVSCVGKTTIGKRAATLMGLAFSDLDEEVETLLQLLARPESRHSVIALPPSGLMGGYLRDVKNSAGLVVALWDEPKNILDRITFYDIDSRRIDRRLPAVGASRRR